MDGCIQLHAWARVSEVIALSSKVGAFAGEPPLQPTLQRFYEILYFLPRLKKERSFSIPAVLNQQKSLRKAQTKGRKRLAGLRARGHSARRLSSGRPVVESARGGNSGVAMATRKPRALAETIAGNFSTKNLSVAPPRPASVGFTPVFSRM